MTRIEQIGDATLHLGDCLDIMRGMAEHSVDAIVTDPPYGLSFMGNHWDYDVPTVEVWKEAIRVLKPGGHLLAFAGTRTQHRMACAIEDAGFDIRDLIAWVLFLAARLFSMTTFSRLAMSTGSRLILQQKQKTWKWKSET